ncbi:hypothetical protein HRR99_20385 [Agrobacterium vaccinii]|uniref:hypothetical protein n=1 Tax=Agrobacterium vaccinii TaxID=2735528 RepID=UPI001E44F4F7|nr:hypothetical protein [Agrobacterium vaccinii]UHS63888.1 hypothetical protein HRR99_20385 [Agrobacterium vaccinii]
MGTTSRSAPVQRLPQYTAIEKILGVEIHDAAGNQVAAGRTYRGGKADRSNLEDGASEGGKADTGFRQRLLTELVRLANLSVDICLRRADRITSQ